MCWIFPRVQKWFFENYLAFLRLVFWLTSQKLKKLKSKHLLLGC